MKDKFYNEDHERAIISTALLRRDAVELIMRLNEDDFYNEDTRAYFAAVCEVEKQNQAVSLVTVNNQLLKTAPDKAGQFVKEFGAAPAYHGIDVIFRQLRELSNKRAFFKLIADGYQELKEYSTPLDDVIGKIDAGIKSIYEKSYRSGKRYGDLGLGPERFTQNKLMPTEMDFLDDIIQGFRQSQLIILGARTSVGKSAFALNIAMNFARKKKVLLFSLEMDQEEIELRMAGIESRVNTDTIDAGIMSSEQKEKFTAAEERLKNIGLIIYDDVYALNDIRSLTKKEYYAGGLGLVVVDYLQQVEVDSRADRHLQVAEISRTLKRLSKDCKVPVLALSQMNRVAAGEEPQLHHLRESGSIEQDANLVIFLYDPKDEGMPGICECIIAKNRRSRTGKTTMMFEKRYQRFSKI